MPGRVIFKLLPEHRAALAVEGDQTKSYRLTNAGWENICAAQGDYAVKLLFPHHFGRKAKTVDLSLIGELIFEEPVNVPFLCHQLSRTGLFEYVEPRMVHTTSGIVPESCSDKPESDLAMFYEPNDSLVNQQWHLEIIKAYDAWDIEKGDTSIMIGIVDTGVDTSHEDLIDNIALNHADSINGIDDDQNGFVDDYYGWDFYYSDNDPKPYNYHGTAAAGAAAATTDNSIGIASPGFNSKVVAIKCSEDANNLGIGYGYEGMVYAAERGAKVINCSWGGFFFDYLGVDIVEYITLDRNSLVISIAHNYDNEELLYPGSLPYVLNVAATNSIDKKEGYSSYSRLVDISAPSTIWSTEFNTNGYKPNYSGTSFAAPLVSGAAALLAAYDTTLTALQIGERLRVTSDFIDDVNPDYTEKLGKGRLNMYRALTETQSPSVRFEDELFTDNRYDIFAIGDTISLSGTFINYLANVTDLEVTLSAPGQDIEIIKGSLTIGSLSTMEKVDNHDDPFLFVIGPGVATDEDIEIRLGFEAPSYSDYQWLFTTINRTSIDIDNGVLATTVNSNGRIGYHRGYGDGLGLIYQDNFQVSGSFGLMLGHSIFRVSDAALDNWNSPNIFSNDYKIVDLVDESPFPFADISLSCAYDDSGAWPPSARLELVVNNNVFTNMGDHFIITEYEVTNNSANIYEDFQIGLWGLTDLYPYWKNRAEQDSSLQLGYAYHATEESPYIGMQLLGQTPYNLYVIEYTDSVGYDGVDLLDGYFSTQEKYITMSEHRPSGGFLADEGGDVDMVVSTGPFVFAPGESLKATFAILVADSLEALKLAAQDAIDTYESIVGTETILSEKTNSLKIYPNPAGDQVIVKMPIVGTRDKASISLFDLSGKMISQFITAKGDSSTTLLTSHLPKGMYLLQLRTAEGVWTGKFVKD